MKIHGTSLGFALCVALSCVVPVLSQTAEITDAATATTTANVYVQVAKGINVYNATAAGKLTLVKGSPFAVSGQMEGHNGKYLISVGTTNLHTNAIGSNGAVGKQIGNINTQLYSGSECGTTSFNGIANGAFLEHTGQHFYVQLYGALTEETDGDGNYWEAPTCAAWQSYEVQSNGVLTFVDGLEYWDDICDFEQCYHEYGPWAVASTVPTVSSNDNFAYGMFGNQTQGPYSYSLLAQGEDYAAFSTLVLAPNGLIAVNSSFSKVDPLPQTVSNGDVTLYVPIMSKADPANHLAVLMYPNADYWENYTWPLQLASYTIANSTGDITSTNTWENMPIPAIMNVSNMSMSPSGKVLALAGHPGLQLFHFNGAAPITTYSSVLLPAINVDQLGWDNNNHLYALSYASQKLYVYAVTPTTITAVAGSPYTVPTAYGVTGLIVVPK